MPRITAILAIAAAAVFAGPAAANARTIATQDQSDRAARAELQAVVISTDEDNADGTSTFDLDPCDATGRVAFCDYTMYYASGDACDGEVEIRYSRRGRLVATVDEYYCDSDDSSDEDVVTS